MTSNILTEAALKAITHAILIPTVLFIVLFTIDKSLSLLSFTYWVIPAFVYLISKEHKKTGEIFFGIIGGAVALVLISAILIMS